MRLNLRQLLVVALLAALLFVGGSEVAVAEIAPFYYERMQKSAPEALAIDVIAVDKSVKKTDEGSFISLTVQARVRQVERSASGVKVGDVITIAYGVADYTAPRPGMGEPPVLQKGQYLMAYLQKEKEEKGARYELAAHGRSFVTPSMTAPGPTPPRPK